MLFSRAIPSSTIVGGCLIRSFYAGTDWCRLFKSTDGGETWNKSNSGLTDSDVLAHTIDPNTPQTVYVGTRGGGIFKSSNGGAAWKKRSSGLETLIVHSLIISGASKQGVYREPEC
jgi:photosystem II stability/assembly factor-like uncharacterized protein